MTASGNPQTVLAFALALTAAGCSNHATAGFGSACRRKLLTADDVTGVLHAPSTAREIPGDNGSTCRFTTADYASLSVTLRPGMGKTSLAIWKSGKMPVSGVSEQGVGDEAVWVEGLHEVVARKNDLLCDIQVTGPPAALDRQPAATTRKAIGALCNKIFDAER